jgi:hypothetical protein
MNHWIELDEDAEVNVEEIMKKIQDYVSERRTQENLGTVLGADYALLGNLSDDTYKNLTAAVQANTNLGLSLDVRRSSTPIIGPILDYFRRSLHQLVLFYVNKTITKQIAINSDILKTLACLISDTEKHETALAQLKLETRRESDNNNPDSET